MGTDSLLLSFCSSSFKMISFSFAILDGHENTLEVTASQPKSSPAKQKMLDLASQAFNSLSKQRTQLQICNNTDEYQSEPKLKIFQATDMQIDNVFSDCNYTSIGTWNLKVEICHCFVKIFVPLE